MKRFFLSAGYLLVCAAAAPAQGVVAGKVAETMDSGGYTYVRVSQGKESSWVATSPQKLKVGEEVSFGGGPVMTDFYSKTLKRTFKKITFSDGRLGGAAMKGAVPHGSSMSAPSGHGPAPAQFTVKLAKAEGPGAYTVAEVFGRRAELAGKTVSVRGRVVKVSLDIMDRNWVHLQDGSGDPKAATHDLLATTSASPKVGETVTARGTVAKDKDFGSGYSYTVMLERTAFTR